MKDPNHFQKNKEIDLLLKMFFRGDDSYWYMKTDLFSDKELKDLFKMKYEKYFNNKKGIDIHLFIRFVKPLLYKFNGNVSETMRIIPFVDKNYIYDHVLKKNRKYFDLVNNYRLNQEIEQKEKYLEHFKAGGYYKARKKARISTLKLQIIAKEDPVFREKYLKLKKERKFPDNKDKKDRFLKIYKKKSSKESIKILKTTRVTLSKTLLSDPVFKNKYKNIIEEKRRLRNDIKRLKNIKRN